MRMDTDKFKGRLEQMSTIPSVCRSLVIHARDLRVCCAQLHEANVTQQRHKCTTNALADLHEIAHLCVNSQPEYDHGSLLDCLKADDKSIKQAEFFRLA